MRFTFTRDFYIPKGSTKVADKHSDAVAYVYTSRRGSPSAAVFVGKQAKPVWNYTFATEAARERKIVAQFEARRAWAKMIDQRQAERKAETHNLEVGHVLKASWGYEQTNVDFYQVTAIVSPKMIELRPIASTPGKSLSSMSGTVLPVVDHFTGELMRKRANRHGVRIDSSRYASVWDGAPVFESSWH